MNMYTECPKRGNGRKIWKALEAWGAEVTELHYNPNNFGRDPENGWGSWGVQFYPPSFISQSKFGWLCGIVEGEVYIEKLDAPYTRIWLSSPAAQYERKD